MSDQLLALVLQELFYTNQSTSILGIFLLLFRKLSDRFQKCFWLIVDGPFVVILNKNEISSPLDKVSIVVEIENSRASGLTFCFLLFLKGVSELVGQAHIYPRNNPKGEIICIIIVL